MNKIALNAYLLFDGNCREAMAFYQGLFGGKLEMMTFGEVDNSCPLAMKDNIMHSSLMGGEVEFLGSDNPEPRPKGSGNISLAISGNDEARLSQLFNNLAEGGKVVIPLEKQVWGDLFGVVSDPFGIDWMVNIGTVEAKY
ncbi:MAG TPA: VOC family protein [Cyclobacteriaceae bacterium]|nr:VOC family protein [Cyclobacteriaceae bacterium]